MSDNILYDNFPSRHCFVLANAFALILACIESDSNPNFCAAKGRKTHEMLATEATLNQGGTGSFHEWNI